MGTSRVIGSLLAALILALAPALPARSETDPEAGPAQAAQLTLDDLRTFTDVFNQVRRNYVEPVDDHTLLDAAIRGMLSELDPHSEYLPDKELQELNESSSGRYTGIGVDIQVRDQKLVVDAVIDDSPADQAGINPGDVVTAIEGRGIAGRPLPDAMDELLGEPGTALRLTVLTPEGEERDVTLTRKQLRIPTLSYELLENGFGYFKMTLFHRESATHLKEALDSIHAEGTELRGLVIDLRNNPGGILQQAIAMADGFLDEGLILTTRGRNAKMQMEFTANPGQWLPGKPLVVLVDRGTASASEVFAGAVQDNGRALIVGERTFGKGSVQSVLPLRNGSGIKLTTARYYTPAGHSIQARGIEPDIEIRSPVAGDERKRESELDGHLEHEPDEGRAATARLEGMGEDFSLDVLLDVLNNAGILSGTNPVTADRPMEEPL